MNKRQKKKISLRMSTSKVRKQNKILCDRYPFLLPNNDYHDKRYEWTLLDEMPAGWRKAFGKELCEDLREVLLKNNLLHEYRVFEIKEKFGELRWYDNGENEEVYDLLHDYAVISRNVCIMCGKPDVPMTLGYWIYPACRKCFDGNPFRGKKISYDEITKHADGLIQESYTMKIYGSGKTSPDEIHRDISDKVARVRARYRGESK